MPSISVLGKFVPNVGTLTRNLARYHDYTNEGNMRSYLFDTNVLNNLLDKIIDPASISRGMRCCITAVQLSELSKTKDSTRRKALLSYFKRLEDVVSI